MPQDLSRIPQLHSTQKLTSPASMQMTGLYCRWMIPGLLPFTWAVLLMKALQAQNIFWAPAILTMATCILNVPLTIFFMRWAGFQGAAAAPSVARMFMLISVLGLPLQLSVCRLVLDCADHAAHLYQLKS